MYFLANHRPRKRFGQNFLQSQPIIQQIISTIHLQPTDTVVEIGPGQGALTKPLLQILNALTAIEIDRDLHAFLTEKFEKTGKLSIIEGDALAIDYTSLGNSLRIIGNLPYNISTPLLLHLIRHAAHIKDMHFMLQKEVVQRMSAPSGTSNFGRLSVITQYYCAVDYLFTVPASAFYPEPKVESAVVRLVPYTVSPYPAVDVTSLQTLVTTAFSMRRKTLANNLKPVITANQLEQLAINPGLRPEQIQIEEFIKITNFVSNKVQQLQE